MLRRCRFLQAENPLFSLKISENCPKTIGNPAKIHQNDRKHGFFLSRRYYGPFLALLLN